MKWKWIGVFIPFIFGFGVDILLSRIWREIPILYLRADIGTLILFTGLIFTALAMIIFSIRDWATDRQEELQNKLQFQAADERRRFLRRLDHELKNPLTAIRAGSSNP